MQKIKKQIKRSLPFFLIFNLLIGSTVFGVVFNFEIKISDKLEAPISIQKPIANAQSDIASTTVTVRNAPPTIVGEVAESPISSSTSPINVGENISFTVTATDDEDNSYYLLVCDSAGATPLNGGAPSCNNTEFCVSAAASSTVANSCNYAVQDTIPSSESDAWFAYVCDDHAGEAVCTDVANQGAGDSGSPLYINHRPQFSYVYTSDNDKDPGGTFTVTASSTDSDIVGGVDEKYLYICQDNSWSTTTGCGGVEFCSGTSSVNSISCSFATTTPARDGSFTYYAFVKDWHQYAATGTPTNTYTVNNVAPTVSSVSLNSGTNIELNMKGMIEAVATSTFTVSDNNHCSDVDYATSSIYYSAVTGSWDCSADDNNCYQIAAVSCIEDAGTCTSDPTDTNVDYTCTTQIAYHTIPTDNSGGNINVDDWWEAAGRAIDDNGATGVSSSTMDLTDVETLTALEVDEGVIPYGSIRSGQDTGTYNATTTVVNYGNSPLDSDMSGTDMDDGGSNSIAAIQQEFDVSTFSYGGAPNYLTNTVTSTSTLNVVIGRPISQASTTDEVYWGIGIPAGKASGDYYGINTFSAALDQTDW